MKSQLILLGWGVLSLALAFCRADPETVRRADGRDLVHHRRSDHFINSIYGTVYLSTTPDFKVWLTAGGW
jgi:hypothetical protein